MSSTTLGSLISAANPFSARDYLKRHFRRVAYRRLDQVRAQSRLIPFGDRDRFVLFSDLHRGDGGRTDLFAPNERLFVQALAHYFRRGFTYVEVGDGDELWQHHCFSSVQRAYSGVFEWLHKFNNARRLHMVVGNHDIQGGSRRRVVKDGLISEEGFRLRHRESGDEIFVVHGHQADARCDDFGGISRFFVRYFWRPMVTLGMARAGGGTEKSALTRWVESLLQDWVRAARQITIAGHTHHAAFPEAGRNPYINIGSGTRSGIITGLELVGGAIRPIQWVGDAGSLGVCQPTGPWQPLGALRS